MSPEELDEARAKEAVREMEERNTRFSFLEAATIAARKARENWTPPEPEPVDPDLLAFREWLANDHEADAWTGGALLCRLGRHDDTEEARAYLAGARMAREQERDRAKVLDWMTDQTSLELAWRADPEEDGVWCVHRVTGGVNDREWRLVAVGQTPLSALMNARAIYDLAKYRGEA